MPLHIFEGSSHVFSKTSLHTVPSDNAGACATFPRGPVTTSWLTSALRLATSLRGPTLKAIILVYKTITVFLPRSLASVLCSWRRGRFHQYAEVTWKKRMGQTLENALGILRYHRHLCGSGPREMELHCLAWPRVKVAPTSTPHRCWEECKGGLDLGREQEDRWVTRVIKLETRRA